MHSLPTIGKKKSFSTNELNEIKINKEKFPKLRLKKECCLQTSLLNKIFNKKLITNTNNLLAIKDFRTDYKYYTSNLISNTRITADSSPFTLDKNIVNLNKKNLVDAKLNTYEKKEFSNDEIINIFETHYSKIENDENQSTYMEDCLNLIKSLEGFLVSLSYEEMLKEIMEQTFKNFSRLQNNKNINSGEEKDILVLDMDETLLHADSSPNPNFEYDYYDELYSPENKIGICIRPGLHEFLNQISKYYDLILFSAGKRDYVEKVISTVNIKNNFLMILCYDETINIVNEIYIKDLRLIYFIDYLRSNKSYFNRSEIQSVNFQNSNDLDCDCRSLNKIIEDFLKLDISNIKSNKISESELVKQKEVIIVDNNIYSFCINMDYGVLVEDFYNDKEDLELERLTQFLIDISNNKRNNGTRLNYQIKEIFNYNSLQ